MTASEWLLVAVETFFVVVGVFIAFELGQWAEDRKDKAQVERLLERLLNDARSAVNEIEGHHDFSVTMLARARPIATEFSAGRCPEDIGDPGALATRLSGMNPPMSAYTELVNTIGLSALPDEATKQAVVSYAYQVNFLNAAFAELREQSGPLLSPRDPRVSFPMTDRPVDRYRTTWQAGPEEPVATYDRDALCADPAFRQAYTYAVKELELATLLRADTLAILASTCERIGAHVGELCMTKTMKARMGRERTQGLMDLVTRYRNR
ncbi:hypothetical protein B2G71_14755 [Novosphingobium sp. PC22D]|uniref:hypothetical protein n=1 Tax=Novosphingobium sp. PC22D TaxID=1962403 RepID=UPI000BF184C1|nr:hypothetical protein [Novosphingobium sp. PC22D]PEQ12034.1 hypothetical protein B2G71_14755 [Novosphingobium sp. PC22D]